MQSLAAATVILFALWLIALAIAAFVWPERVRHFFSKFASSASTHFLEMFLRLIAGAAFVIYAPQMKFPTVFTIVGWTFLLTTAVLMFVPWRMHKRFADRSLPTVTNRMPLFALISLLAGLFILSSVVFAPNA